MGIVASRSARRAALVLGSVVALLLAACERDPTTLERGEAQPLQEVDYAHHHQGEDGGRLVWESRAVADIGERDLMIVVYPTPIPGNPSVVHLVDRTTGELAGELRRLGAFPLVAYHRESGRLVISDMRAAVPPGHDPQGGGFAPWFWVMAFDVDAGLTLETEVPLSPYRTQASAGPGRVSERGELTLSRDGRYVYVLWGGAEREGPGGVGIIDLEGEPEVLATVPYPERDEVTCGRGEPALYPLGPSAVMLTCTGVGIVRVIEPDGSVREDLDIEGMGALHGFPEWGDRVTPAATAVDTPSGIGLIETDGSFVTVDQDGATNRGRALPEGTTLFTGWASDVLSLDETRLVLPYRTREDAAPPTEPFAAPVASGIVLFNLETATIEQNIAIEHRGSYPVGGAAVALIEDGRIDVVDLSSMTIRRSVEALTLEDLVGESASAMEGRPVLPRVR